MSQYRAGQAVPLVAQWLQYPGGPPAPVTDVKIQINAIPSGTVVLAMTATGVTAPATGINAYSWASGAGLAAGSYLATWTATDADLDTINATEVIDLISALVVPLGGPYATRAALKARMGIPDATTSRDAELDARLMSAAVDINRWTHRQFGRAEVATERQFWVTSGAIETHDFWSTEDLAVTPYLANVAQGPWDIGAVSLEPLDGIVDEVPGWPWRKIVGAYGDHPLWRAANWAGYKARVTAKWGWATVPENVTTANLMLAVMGDKAKDAPFGVAGFGDYAVRVRSNPMVEEMLKPYVIDPIKVAA